MKIMTDAQFRRILNEEKSKAVDEAMAMRNMREDYDRKFEDIWSAIYEIRRAVFPVNPSKTTTEEIKR